MTSRSLLVPSEVVLAGAAPPDVDGIVEQLRKVAGEVHDVDTRTLMGTVGEARALNVLMLGAALGFGLLPIPEPVLMGAIHARCGQKYMEANRRAFSLGRDAFPSRQARTEDGRVHA